jgi:signal transduction histidine kinase
VHATARWAQGSSRWTAVVLLVAGAVAQLLSQPDYDGPLGVVGNVVLVAAFGSAAWVAGAMPRGAADRDQEREAERLRAVETERARISRDLHDVVGHALASISLTAGAARRQAAGADPEMATALDLIGTTSREAAADVRRVVGMLRESSAPGAGPLDLDPQPTLSDLPALVQRAHDAGLEVQLQQQGRARHIPAGLQLTVYRVVQEGLTNVLKHAPGAGAVVCLDWSGQTLTVTVRDRGGPSSPASEPGFGLAGLAERVAVYDGDLVAGAGADGFDLVAELPLP